MRKKILRYRKLRLFIEFLNTYWAVTSVRFEKCVCLALCLYCIKYTLLGSQWSLWRLKRIFFLHSEYKLTTGFLSYCSFLFDEALEFGQSWRKTIGWYTIMFLKDWHSLTMPHMCAKIAIGCGIRIHFSSRTVLLLILYCSVAKATFSKCLATVFKKSCTIECTQAIGNTLLSYLCYI